VSQYKYYRQSRPDADDFIEVLTDKVIPGLLSNFLQRSPSEVDYSTVPYDFGSVMHYGPTVICLVMCIILRIHFSEIEIAGVLFRL